MNTNPDTKRILCFGDSYTWGYKPLTNHIRYAPDKRWTGVLQNLLGEGYEIIEEGLNSRTLVSDDPRPGKEGKNGSLYLVPCLDTHDPIDIVVLMLGTNELKERYKMMPDQIITTLEEKFIKIILNHKSQSGDRTPKLLLIAPPVIDGENEYAKERGYVTQKSKEFVNVFRNKYSKDNRMIFIDSNDYVVSGEDGVHFGEESHRKLAEGICNKVKSI